MMPLNLDSLSKCACLDFAADAPRLPPLPPPPAGRNASCSSTFPGENQHPPSCPQRVSGADQGGYWHVDDGPYGQPYNDGSHYGDSWHRESHRHLTTKTGASKNMHPSRTDINHSARTGPVSTCLPDISTPCLWTFSRMLVLSRTNLFYSMDYSMDIKNKRRSLRTLRLSLTR
jgi:hypothetical protein